MVRQVSNPTSIMEELRQAQRDYCEMHKHVITFLDRIRDTERTNEFYRARIDKIDSLEKRVESLFLYLVEKILLRFMAMDGFVFFARPRQAL